MKRYMQWNEPSPPPGDGERPQPETGSAWRAECPKEQAGRQPRAWPREPRSIAEELFRLRLERAVDELPGLQQQVFRRRAFERMRPREIAEDLGRPLGTVKATLHQARAALRAELGDDYQVLTGIDRTNTSKGES